MSVKVIFIGAHPDDIELGCSATIKKFIENGFEVHCHYLTRGEKCGHPHVREIESIVALSKHLGVPESQIHFADKDRFSDTQIPDGGDTITYLEEVFNYHEVQKSDYKHEIYGVFTHSIHDRHQDHRAIANSSFIAFRGAKRLFSYESPSSTNSFNPSKYLGFEKKFLDIKMAALECHKSQLDLQRRYLKLDSVTALAYFRSKNTRYNYAEAFEIIWDEFEIEPLSQRKSKLFKGKKIQPIALPIDY